MSDDIYSMTKAGFHEAIRQAKEQAWDEGAAVEADDACEHYIPCGSCDTCMGPELPNPYRKGDL